MIIISVMIITLVVLYFFLSFFLSYSKQSKHQHSATSLNASCTANGVN